MSRNKRRSDRIEWLDANKRTGNYRQGRFIPDNKDKYLGDVNKIIFRSSWELVAFEFCDDNAHVLNWSSEEIAIPYIKPTFKAPPSPSHRKARYFPDLFVVLRTPSGKILKEMIEIKPDKQRKPSKARKLTTKANENATLVINTLKWKAAENWCKRRNIRFRILTEKEIFC